MSARARAALTRFDFGTITAIFAGVFLQHMRLGEAIARAKLAMDAEVAGGGHE